MSNPYSPSPKNRSNRQLLAEFLLPTTPGLEDRVVQDITTMIRQFGLEPRQMDQIMSAIAQSLQDQEGSSAPFPVRISISGLDLDELFQEAKLVRPLDTEFAGSGLGFFLVKRIVGQINDPDPASYRLLEVLIYREVGQSKE